jgi:hypothetical protein
MGDMTVDELKDKKLWFLWSAKAQTEIEKENEKPMSQKMFKVI